MKELVDENNELVKKISNLEGNNPNTNMISASQKAQEEKKRRLRRTAGEITRSYKCPVPYCEKSYGSEGSLCQHIRLKHNDNINELLAKVQNGSKFGKNSESNKYDSEENREISLDRRHELEKKEEENTDLSLPKLKGTKKINF